MSVPPEDRCSAISASRVRELAAKYADVIPADLANLDEARSVLIPSNVQTRDPPHLKQSELVRLVEWKLKHGKFRPNLMKLAKSNDEDAVETATSEAYELFAGTLALGHLTETAMSRLAQSVLKKLSKLAGVGPATASLLLSVFDIATAPFFADELFRWLHMADGEEPTKATSGWERKIKYDMKECLDFFERVHALLARLNNGSSAVDDEDAASPITALDLERATYVLARGVVANAPKDGLLLKRAVSEAEREPRLRTSKRQKNQ